MFNPEKHINCSDSVMYNAEKHKIVYDTESSSTASYLLDSPIEEDLSHVMNYDENSMRLKLQELEKALLDDDDDDMDDGVDESISPKESTTTTATTASSESYVSSINSSSDNYEVKTLKSTPKDMLFGCAAAISDGKIEEASVMINELRQTVSIQGEPDQRIAAYMVEALAARVAASGKGLYKALKCKEPPSLDRLSAMQVLFEVCPCFRFGFMAANGAIIDAFQNEKIVHIVDFDINQGSQYISLLQTVAKTVAKPPFLRLTGVDDPESVQRPVGGLNLIGKRLVSLAESLKLPFEFTAMAARTEDVTPDMVVRRDGEALLVNFAFQLHHMPDESVSTVNQRDRLLRTVKSMNPKLVTVVEQDVNTNTAPFLTRFGEAYRYYSAVFESLEATLTRNSQDRVNVEKQCLARDIVNIVACEGEERIERYEVAGKWRARMMMAGFASSNINTSVKTSIRELIKQYCERFRVKEDSGALHFAWEDRVLIVASAWK